MNPARRDRVRSRWSKPGSVMGSISSGTGASTLRRRGKLGMSLQEGSVSIVNANACRDNRCKHVGRPCDDGQKAVRPPIYSTDA
jgi:hypothetical protein